MAEPPGVLLAIESASACASVALWRDGHVAVVRASDRPRQHAEVLLALVDDVLTSGGAAIGDVEAFAIAIGPGSFTSLRVGLATLKGLAFGDAQPVAAVSSLEALAFGARGEADRVVALLDARRSELYAAEFDTTARQVDAGQAGARQGGGGALRPTLPERVCTASELADRLSPGALLVGEAVAETQAALRSLGRDDLVAREPAEAAPRAASVAALGVAQLAAGRGVGASGLVPRYLYRAEAEVKRTGLRFEPAADSAGERGEL